MVMDATPINFENAAALGAPVSAAGGSYADAVMQGWDALHEAAAVVAVLAGLPAEPLAAEIQAFGVKLVEAPHWLRDVVLQGVEDLAAIMEPGLAALIAVHSGGGDPAVPARALWGEFVAARDALLAAALPRD
jgi:hypothetical protein